jgi:hypothetical protein
MIWGSWGIVKIAAPYKYTHATSSDMTYERTNITLPRYLKNLAHDAGLNLSQELQSRLKEVLHVAE